METIVPGVIAAYAIYFDEDERRIKALQWNLNSGVHEIDCLKDLLPDLQKIRREKQEYLWLNDDQIPFEKKLRVKRQMLLEDELDNNLLLLKFKSPFDLHFDLLYLHFRNNFSPIDLSSAEKPLSAENKSLVGKLLFRQINHFIHIQRQDKEVFQTIVRSHNHLNNLYHDLGSRVGQMGNLLKETVEEYCRIFEEDIQEQQHVQVHISNTAIDRLCENGVGLRNVRKILKNALQLAINLSFGDKEVTIEAYHIQLESAEILPESARQVPVKYRNIMEFLDKYEEAAIKAIERSWPVQGKTIAELCQVTPAAISFNLKKYEKRITELMELCPEKWTVLRSEFKPLLGLLERNIFPGGQKIA
ncbi:MAG: hypothetical protein ACK4K0_09455 [Flavobacteriales bacterium]